MAASNDRLWELASNTVETPKISETAKVTMTSMNTLLSSDVQATPQVLASGIAVGWALEAQRLLRDDWGVLADVWSVTSWTELRRDALTTDEWNRAHPQQPHRTPYVTRRLHDAPGPLVAVSDWMRAVPDQIAPFVSRDWTSLGTDGFGHSDTWVALRRHFGIDAYQLHPATST